MRSPRLTLALAPLLLLSGCAYVGEPLPPALHVPRPVTAVTVAQVGSKIQVGFVPPLKTTDELELEISATEIRVGDSAAAAAWPAGTQAASADGMLDAKSWVGKQVLAGVRVQSKQGKWSAWSPLAPLAVIEPLATPAAAKSEAAPRGARLSWQAVKRPGAMMRVERRTGKADKFIEAALVEESSGEWIDAQARFGEEQQYRITAVIDPQASSEAVTLPAFTPVDKFAPAVPAALSAVTGLGSIELSWERPAETDLAGFRVYRSLTREGGAGFTRISPEAPAAAASYSDRTVQAGTAYRFRVTSVDQAGNESQPSAPVEITAPN